MHTIHTHTDTLHMFIDAYSQEEKVILLSFKTNNLSLLKRREIVGLRGLNLNFNDFKPLS